jgi:phenylalanyl-tRNA synthetase alpha chain
MEDIMKGELERILKEAKNDISASKDTKTLEEQRIKYLGKKGVLKSILSKLGGLSENERKEIGKHANEVKTQIEGFIQTASDTLEAVARESRLKSGIADLSVGTKTYPLGFYNPLTIVRDRMVAIFKSMGYSVEEGPELEEEFYNFEALNIPAQHPARDDHDSFYVSENELLRTHTSPVQARVMKKRQPPLAIVVPGRCFRRDAVDATHSHTFHQMEGLVVDTDVTFADLKGTLSLWARMMFGENTRIRLRPDFFPFTEPSAELAVSCWVCGGKGCNVCKGTGWVELAGCGMVDPEVFKAVGYDADKYSGFAFGMGLERIAMALFGINDIREFYENDLRLLEQFVK